MSAENNVEVLYRINQGPTEKVTAKWLRNDTDKKSQYFRASLPPLHIDDTVEYTALGCCAGRQVPSPQEAQQFRSTFRVVGAEATATSGLASRTAVRGEPGMPIESPGGPLSPARATSSPTMSLLQGVTGSPTTQDISLARLFEEPLVPIGADPTPTENAALAAALLDYSKRSGPDDFSSLAGFLESYPTSPWNAALLTNLGLEYYNTGHYSKALDAWRQAWQLARAATDPKGKALASRALGELAYMHARLGQMTELDALLHSVEGHVFSGPVTERITGAREALWTMQNRPEIAFRCGPLALHRIKLSADPQNPGTDLIHAAASTPKGCSLLQVARLSDDLGLNLQMVFRTKDAAFVVPSIVHLKLDHYAAIVRQEQDRYLLEDPTFGNGNWVTREALEAEASGYFLIPPGELAYGWRTVEEQEGETVWGKGLTTGNDPEPHGPCDPNTGDDSCPKNDNDCKVNDNNCGGMAIPRVHLMLVSLNINDEPVGYSPPVGPAVRFKVRYNQRDARQPAIFTYSNLGPKWTFDWLSYITDNPASLGADVTYYIMGGGTRTFTGFDSNTQTYAVQQFDQTRLTRTSPNTYGMLSGDGTKKVFSQPDGSIGTSRKIFLTQLIDPFGNAVSLTYDTHLRVVAITDALGQVTTISYDHPTDIYKITRVTDPFDRFATFDYDASEWHRLIQITDAIGITSQFTYDAGDFITALTTPYGVTSFTKGENGTTRSLETLYPDGNRDRVEYNQNAFGIPMSDPPQTVPGGMATDNNFLIYRNTYYWSKIAYAYAYPDYTKAKIYHWLHTADLASTSGILESVKEPLEGRVWYDYADQTTPNGSRVVGSTNNPTHVGRVLDDGSTQLYTYEYNDFGNIIKEVDPVGRTFSYIYAANGIDLLEIRQTRAGQNQLLSQMTYNPQHLPLTSRDAAGQMTTFTYNARGQLLTETNPKGETTTYSYDANGYLTRIDEALPGTATTSTYDRYGRVRSIADVDDYTLTLDYDPLDRVTKVTYPDGTFVQFTYDRLDKTLMRDRAGRSTIYEFDTVGQRTKQTDPLGRVLRYQWCKCGDLRSITDPMGRTTTWRHDIQGRPVRKEYPDGSKITYRYERATSRLKQVIDEKRQVKQYNYNRDDTISSIHYSNAAIATPSVQFTHDPNYRRLTSITDGIGTTTYDYYPITPIPTPGAGMIASVDGPLPNDTIEYSYDELGRVVSRRINGAEMRTAFDAIGRITSTSNALGSFAYTYEGGSRRVLSISYPNGLTARFHYLDNLGDRLLERITHQVGATPISEFSYAFDPATQQINSWAQQSDTQVPQIYSFGYDQVNQLLSANMSQAGNSLHTFGYTYDSAGNRLTEQVDTITRQATYNALNQLTTCEVDAATSTTYEWDAEQRLTAVEAENRRAEFTYDWQGRRVGIRHLENGIEVANRRFVWCDAEICEERAADGTIVKRFFDHGVKVEIGAASGQYVYTRDHLGSVCELIDAAGAVRSRYDFDPYGRRTKIAGDLDADFGFTGYFFDGQTALCLPMFRAYDAELGRWLLRDPLEDAEILQGPNLYVYVGNDPVNNTDPLGLKEKGGQRQRKSKRKCDFFGCFDPSKPRNCEEAKKNCYSSFDGLCFVEEHFRGKEKGRQCRNKAYRNCHVYVLMWCERLNRALFPVQ